MKKRREVKMYNKGDFIVYDTVGVCEVKDISKPDFLTNDKVYYSLSPVFEKGTIIYVPTDGRKKAMRPILSKEEANIFIDKLPDIKGKEYVGEKERMQAYKEILSSGDRDEWASVMKGIFEVRRARQEKGHGLSLKDAEFMKAVEKLLMGELSVALDIPVNEMADYIGERLS